MAKEIIDIFQKNCGNCSYVAKNNAIGGKMAIKCGLFCMLFAMKWHSMMLWCRALFRWPVYGCLYFLFKKIYVFKTLCLFVAAKILIFYEFVRIYNKKV